MRSKGKQNGEILHRVRRLSQIRKMRLRLERFRENLITDVPYCYLRSQTEEKLNIATVKEEITKFNY
jgi:hypothetical protein